MDHSQRDFSKPILLRKNQILEDRYRIDSPIGEGGMGLVYLAYDLHLQEKVVVKQIELTGGVKPSRHEVDTLKKLTHSYLPKVYDYLVRNNYVFTIMGYVEGTSLEELIQIRGGFSTGEVVHWLTQLTEVLVYLEKNHVVHSDIKPGNIIITPDQDAILIDFNISVNALNPNVIGLTPDYASPEQLNCLQAPAANWLNQLQLDSRSDIYSLGATFYTVMSGKKPSAMFYTRPLKELNTGYPEILCDFVGTAMQRDPGLRFQTAVSMKRSLDNLWKVQSGYRKYLAGQVGVIALSALLLSMGVYFTITGARSKERLAYTASYNEAIMLINNESYAQAGAVCNDLLNEYGRVFEDYPEQKAEVLKGLGDVFYNQGDFDRAVQSYKDAADLIADKSALLVLDCYTGMIHAYLDKGDQNLASYTLTKAEISGIHGGALELLHIQIDSSEGRYRDCASRTEQLIGECNDAEILGRACLSCGDAATDDKDRLDWYHRSLPYLVSKTLYRRAGLGLAELAVNAQNEKTASLAYEDAAACYTWLTEHGSASVNDYINLAALQRFKGDYLDSLASLSALENSKILHTDPGLLYMHKAFTYEMQGDSLHAREMVEKGCEIINEAELPEQDLSGWLELKTKYGR